MLAKGCCDFPRVTCLESHWQCSVPHQQDTAATKRDRKHERRESLEVKRPDHDAGRPASGRDQALLAVVLV